MTHHETNLQRLGFVANLVYKKCSPQNYKKQGGSGWVKSGVGECKSPRRGVVRSSAGAGVVYPPFGGSFA